MGTMSALIHTVGDSHAWHAWLKIPFVQTHQIGPMTMYHFGLYHPIVVSDIPTDVPVVFCWGEIDCRCHIYKHPPWEEAIDKLVDEYILAVEHNARIHPNIWLFNVVPPPRKAAVQENPQFPFLGSDAERLGFVLRVNQRLRESGYPFIDVYNKYCDEEGFLLMDQSDGHVHIANHAPLQDWLEKRLSQEEESSINAIPDV